MKNKTLIILGYALLIILTIFFSYYFFKRDSEVHDELILFGNVDIREVDLGFRVFGRLESLLYDEGDRVEKGELMAFLDKTPYEEEVLKSESIAKAAEAEVKKASAKFQKRYKVERRAISREDYDNAMFDLKAMEAAHMASLASFDSSRTKLKDTKLYAPSSGTILTRIREEGAVLSAGEPVYTLSIESPVWVRAYIQEPNLGEVFPGMVAEIFTDSRYANVYHGHVGFISPVAEFTPKNVETVDLRTDLVYRIRIVVDNPNNALKQGMPVTVKLKLKSPKEIKVEKSD